MKVMVALPDGNKEWFEAEKLNYEICEDGTLTIHRIDQSYLQALGTFATGHWAHVRKVATLRDVKFSIKGEIGPEIIFPNQGTLVKRGGSDAPDEDLP